MQNVSPTRNLSRRSRDFLIAAAVVFLLGATLAVVGLALHIINVVVPSNPGFEVYDLTRKAVLSGGIGIIFVALLMALRAVTWKTDNLLAKAIGDYLAQYLDKHFVYIRNISKRSIGYVDAVLVSKHGVLVFRISDRQGVFFNEKGEWLRQKDKGEWRAMRWNPTREAVADVKKIREYLTDFQLPDIPVYGVVVFTHEPPTTQFTMQDPVVPVVHASQLSYGLQDSYFAKDRVNAETVQQLVNLLYN